MKSILTLMLFVLMLSACKGPSGKKAEVNKSDTAQTSQVQQTGLKPTLQQSSVSGNWQWVTKGKSKSAGVLILEGDKDNLRGMTMVIIPLNPPVKGKDGKLASMSIIATKISKGNISADNRLYFQVLGDKVKVENNGFLSPDGTKISAHSIQTDLSNNQTMEYDWIAQKMPVKK